MSTDSAIICENISYRYNRPLVIENASFNIPARRISCLIGPNGGGKSTLLKLFLGLLEPEKGRVRVLGTSPQIAREKVGYMPQYTQFDPGFPITVEAIVAMGRIRSGLFSSRKDRAIVSRVLEEVDLMPYSKAHFRELSGGQKQRVLIARALAVEPEILLLDEPTAMVDAHIEAHLLEKLRELHQKMTIVLVSHDAAFVSGLVEQVICVNRTVELHPVAEMAGEHVHRLYGHPVREVQHSEGCDAKNPHGHHGPLCHQSGYSPPDGHSHQSGCSGDGLPGKRHSEGCSGHE